MKGKPRWWVWVLVGCAGLMANVLLLVVGVVAFAMLNEEPSTIGERCGGFLGTTCERLYPETIERAAAMRLPPGTVIESSAYDQFQDWRW
ncbi:hypothetical protein CGZ93_08950 [Enemella dayhoffiae]|uniref:Uncharacterized protein n=1 Tax=Enemella dayhoffiae TaxID=2016507 RepID=A0A255H2M4_9ACTN|nr:hypothetical protein [Enemella dayhoffiae]OYO22038.1 hypothetical protein CGZ93_08950 [Enemella dayhoffiae]